MTTTVSRFLLGSERDDAKLVLKWADECAKHGGSFSVRNAYEEGTYYSTVTINWPEGMKVPEATGEPHD